MYLRKFIERRRTHQRGSPRASIGFKRLEASTAPSVAPAPMTRVQFVDEKNNRSLRRRNFF